MNLKISEKIQIKKTISWTILSFLVVAIIGCVMTGDLMIGLGIGAADRIIKIGLYYWHERYWHGKYKEAKRAAN